LDANIQTAKGDYKYVISKKTLLDIYLYYIFSKLHTECTKINI